MENLDRGQDVAKLVWVLCPAVSSSNPLLVPTAFRDTGLDELCGCVMGKGNHEDMGRLPSPLVLTRFERHARETRGSMSMNASRAMPPSVPRTMATTGRLLSFLDLLLPDAPPTGVPSFPDVEPVLSGGAATVVTGSSA